MNALVHEEQVTLQVVQSAGVEVAMVKLVLGHVEGQVAVLVLISMYKEEGELQSKQV